VVAHVRPGRAVTRRERARDRVLTIAGEVGMSLVHVLDAVREEWRILRERLARAAYGG